MLAIVSESSSILIFPLSFCRAATFTFVIWPVQPWETFNTGSLCSPENCGLFAEESFIFSKLPGYFIIPFLTSKKKNPQYTSKPHFSTLAVRYRSDSRIHQTHQLLYIKTAKVILFLFLHSAKVAALMPILLLTVAKQKLFTCQSHHLF